jgi:hypothetical protein
LHLDNHSEPEVFITISWALWQRRNKSILNQPMDRIDQVGIMARCYLEEFVKENERASPQLTPALVTRWKPPHTSLYKINYDGAIFKDNNKRGIGIIIRDA